VPTRNAPPRRDTCSSLWLELWFLYIHAKARNADPPRPKPRRGSVRSRGGASEWGKRRGWCAWRLHPDIASRLYSNQVTACIRVPSKTSRPCIT
jgi:hypothetical protein